MNVEMNIYGSMLTASIVTVFLLLLLRTLNIGDFWTYLILEIVWLVGFKFFKKFATAYFFSQLVMSLPFFSVPFNLLNTLWKCFQIYISMGYIGLEV